MKLDRQKDRSVIDRYETNRLGWGIITAFKAGMFLIFQGDIRQRFIPFFSFVMLKLTYSPLKSIYFPISAKTSRTIILLHTVGKQNYLKRGENMFNENMYPSSLDSYLSHLPVLECPWSYLSHLPVLECPWSYLSHLPVLECPWSTAGQCTLYNRYSPSGRRYLANQSINQSIRQETKDEK